MNVWDLIHHSAFDTDYSHFRRDYERDQVKVEKYFWHNVFNNLGEYGTLDIQTTYNSLVHLLYDRPALDMALLQEFEGLSHDSFDSDAIIQRSQSNPNKDKVKNKILIEIISFINETPILQDMKDEKIELTNDYQPHLPNIFSLIWQLNSLANNKFGNRPSYVTKKRKLSLKQLNVFRRCCKAYFPYFLEEIIITRLQEWDKMSIGDFSFKRKVRGPIQAVSRELVAFPWLNFQTKQQTAYRISMYYTDIDGVDFKPNSINKAVNRYRDEQV